MPQIYAVTQDGLPAHAADGSQKQIRSNGYGEPFVLPLGSGAWPFVLEGQYFVATNPTMGTTISLTNQTSFSETAGVMAVLRNTAGAGGKSIYPDFLLISHKTSNTSSTAIELALALDNTNRFSAGGTAITPVNANMGSSNATIAALNVGAVTATAASGSRRFSHRQTLKTAQLTAGDVILVNWGARDSAMGALNSSIQMSPALASACAINPGGSLCVMFWYPSGTTSPTVEFTWGWWER